MVNINNGTHTSNTLFNSSIEEAQGESEKSKTEKESKKLLNDIVNLEHPHQTDKKRTISSLGLGEELEDGDKNNTAKKIKNVHVASLPQKEPTLLERIHQFCNRKNIDESVNLINENKDLILIEQIEEQYISVIFQAFCKQKLWNIASQILEKRVINIKDIDDKETVRTLFIIACSLSYYQAAYKLLSHQESAGLLEALCCGHDAKLQAVVHLIEKGAGITSFSEQALIKIVEHIADEWERLNTSNSTYGKIAYLAIINRYGPTVWINRKTTKKMAEAYHNQYIVSGSIEGLEYIEKHEWIGIAYNMFLFSKTITVADIKNIAFREQFASFVLKKKNLSTDSKVMEKIIIPMIRNKFSFSNRVLKDVCCSVFEYQNGKFTMELIDLLNNVLDKKILCEIFEIACSNSENIDFLMKILQNLDIDISRMGLKNDLVLTTAVEKSNVHFLRLLLEKGADIECLFNSLNGSTAIVMLQTVLTDIEYLELVNKNSTLCIKTPNELWPVNSLTIAEERGLANVAYWWLIDKDAVFTDLKNTDFREKVLEVAISAANDICVDWLAEDLVSFEKITDRDLLAKLFIICFYKDYNHKVIIIISKIIKKDFNANVCLTQKYKDTKSFFRSPARTPLMSVVNHARLEWIQELIENKKADINGIVTNKWSPLGSAFVCSNNKVEKDQIINYLLNHGASVTFQLWVNNQSSPDFENGNTILHKALYSIENIDLIRKIMSSEKTDVVKKNGRNNTPFQELLCKKNIDEREKKEKLAAYFKDYLVIIDAMEKMPTNELPAFFSRYPGKFLQNKNRTKGINPFEWSFLFQDIPLARQVGSYISRENLEKMQLDLKKKFPGSVKNISDFFYQIIYEANPKHYSNVIDVSIPKIENESVEKPKLSQYLLEFFNKINFTNSAKEFYVAPKSIFNQPNQTVESLRNEFLTSIQEKIISHTAYAGTPDATAGNPPVRNPSLDLFCNTIENALYHTVRAIQKIKDPVVAIQTTISFISELLKVLRYCGGRVYSDSIRQYKLAVLGRGESYEERLLDALLNMRQYIFESLAPPGKKGEQSTHLHTVFMKDFGRQFGIIGAKAFEDFNNAYSRHITQNTIANAKSKFITNYSPAQIIDWIQIEMRNSEDFRSAFTDWLKKHVPLDFKVKYYKDILEEFHKVFATSELDEPFFQDMTLPIAGDERIIEFFKSKNIVVDRRDQAITPAKAIEDDRVHEYLTDITDPENSEQLIQRIIDSLIEQNVIRVA